MAGLMVICVIPGIFAGIMTSFCACPGGWTVTDFPGKQKPS